MGVRTPTLGQSGSSGHSPQRGARARQRARPKVMRSMCIRNRSAGGTRSARIACVRSAEARGGAPCQAAGDAQDVRVDGEHRPPQREAEHAGGGLHADAAEGRQIGDRLVVVHLPRGGRATAGRPRRRVVRGRGGWPAPSGSPAPRRGRRPAAPPGRRAARTPSRSRRVGRSVPRGFRPRAAARAGTVRRGCARHGPGSGRSSTGSGSSG